MEYTRRFRPLMNKIQSIKLIAVFCLCSNQMVAQVTLKSFFSEIKHFVAADYSQANLEVLKKWSDSSYVINAGKKKTKQLWYRGKLVTKDNVTIEFTFFTSELSAIGDKKCNGTILIKSKGGCNASLLKSTLSYIPKYYMSFDTVNIIAAPTCSYDKIYLHFNNYNLPTNRVLESVDTSIVGLLKHEYFDFYFSDINKKTSKWQSEFKDFMQPYSKALIEMLKLKKLKSIFEIIALKNKGYSWSFAEGLWYYNSLHSILNKEQLTIIENYNGKKGMIPFRSKEELQKVYLF